ncbi:MAG TPA: hypothetical protein PLS03_17185 [Terrimicrobiaceae bacterium]|nr:hypothetical protein [Terrimicrobiaceae bacterium]
MNDFYAFLTAQALLFLAPLGFAWFTALCLHARPAIGQNILIGAAIGICSSAILFGAFWPIIFPKRETPVPLDGQSGLGQGLITIVLISFSYLVAGLFILIRSLKYTSEPPPLPITK